MSLGIITIRSLHEFLIDHSYTLSLPSLSIILSTNFYSLSLLDDRYMIPVPLFYCNRGVHIYNNYHPRQQVVMMMMMSEGNDAAVGSIRYGTN